MKTPPRSSFARPTACLLFLLAALSISVGAQAAAPKPNVVFILADDLGWSDTMLFETTKFYKTPNIERLAARGMIFSRAYSSSPLCSPTRASVLTGLSPARHGITAPTCHLPKVILKPVQATSGPPNRFATIPECVSRLDTRYYTLAEMFKNNGYATGHFGKWHLGPEPYSPLEHGFDVDVPHHPGPGPAGSYVAPWKFKDFDHDPDIPDEHIEDRMAKEAVAFMEKHKDEPFFLNYWMFSVHAPFDAKQSLIDEYRKKVDPKDPQRSPTYAAMIESMDDAVRGRRNDSHQQPTGRIPNHQAATPSPACGEIARENARCHNENLNGCRALLHRKRRAGKASTSCSAPGDCLNHSPRP